MSYYAFLLPYKISLLSVWLFIWFIIMWYPFMIIYYIIAHCSWNVKPEHQHTHTSCWLINYCMKLNTYYIFGYLFNNQFISSRPCKMCICQSSVQWGWTWYLVLWKKMPAGMFQKNLTCPLTITSFFLEYTGEMHIIALRRVFFS